MGRPEDGAWRRDSGGGRLGRKKEEEDLGKEEVFISV